MTNPRAPSAGGPAWHRIGIELAMRGELFQAYYRPVGEHGSVTWSEVTALSEEDAPGADAPWWWIYAPWVHAMLTGEDPIALQVTLGRRTGDLGRAEWRTFRKGARGGCPSASELELLCHRMSESGGGRRTGVLHVGCSLMSEPPRWLKAEDWSVSGVPDWVGLRGDDEALGSREVVAVSAAVSKLAGAVQVATAIVVPAGAYHAEEMLPWVHAFRTGALADFQTGVAPQDLLSLLPSRQELHHEAGARAGVDLVCRLTRAGPRDALREAPWAHPIDDSPLVETLKRLANSGEGMWSLTPLAAYLLARAAAPEACSSVRTTVPGGGRWGKQEGMSSLALLRRNSDDPDGQTNVVTTAFKMFEMLRITEIKLESSASCCELSLACQADHSTLLEALRWSFLPGQGGHSVSCLQAFFQLFSQLEPEPQDQSSRPLTLRSSGLGCNDKLELRANQFTWTAWRSPPSSATPYPEAT